MSLLVTGGEVDSRIKESSHGHTPLTWAASYGFTATVQKLLDSGADIERGDTEFGETPLMWAAEFAQDATAKCLLERGAQVNAKDTILGRTSLMWAARRGHVATMQLLLDAGADVHVRTKSGVSALHLAAQRGQNVSVEFLLGVGGMDVDCLDAEHWTALSHSVSEGSVDVVKTLLQRDRTSWANQFLLSF